jgi:hypothetical protein
MMFNIPINKAINNMAPDEYRNASALQAKWLHYILIRTIIAVFGFIVLIAGLIVA